MPSKWPQRFGLTRHQLTCQPFQRKPTADDWHRLIDWLAPLRQAEGLDLVVIDTLATFLPGYSWHRTARAWRTPVLGELAMGATTRPVLRLLTRESNATPGPMPDAWLDRVLDHFDQGSRACWPLFT